MRFKFSVVTALLAACVLTFALAAPGRASAFGQIIGSLVWSTSTAAPSATQLPLPSAGSLHTRSDTGQVYVFNGTAWVTYGAIGTAQGMKVAAGTITLDGTNPSSATTGLATITACSVTDKRSTAPGLDPSAFTVATAAVAGRLDVYAWKVTGAGDTTLIASTDADDTIDYVCIGT